MIIAAGLIVYGNSLWGVFIFDDQNSILGNPQIRRLWPLWNAFSAPANTPVAGRPVVALSLAINYALGGLDVRGYHAWNVGVHILCALVLFGIVRRTLGRSPLRERFGGASDGIAAACALIWLVHPLQTEVVNYVTQRTESTMALFYLSHALCRDSRARLPGGPPGGMASRCCPAPWEWPAKRSW